MSPNTVAGLLGLAGIVILAVALALLALDLRSQIERDAQNDVSSEAYLLADHAKRLFEVADVALRSATVQAGNQDWDAIAGSKDLFERLRALKSALPYIQDIWLNDQTGELRLTTFGFPSPRSNAADRDVFEAQRRPTEKLFVGERIVGRVTGTPTFLLARRLSGLDGAFRGMVSVTADLGYFDDYWSRISLPLNARVTLLRTGALDILAQHPAPAPGRDFVAPAEEALRAALAASPDEGQLTLTAADGEARIAAYRQVGDLPVLVTVSVSEAAVAAAWRARVTAYLPFALAATLAFAVLAVLGFRQARSEARASRALAGAREALGASNRRLEATVADLQSANARLVSEAEQRRHAEEQLRQSQKMEAVGRLTGGIAHDFNNLLTVVTGNLDLLRRRMKGAGDERAETLVGRAIEGANRAAALTYRLLAFSRQHPLAPVAIDANKLIAGMSDLVARTLGENIHVETVLAGGLWRTHADPNQLENALLNLAVNARDAMPDGGKLSIETQNAHLDEAYAAARPEVAPGQYVMIAVADTGAGMSAEVMAKAFEPFFTTKPAGKGTGLGLSQVFGFVKQSNGHAAIYSEEGHGTTVKLYLPRFRQKGSATDISPMPLTETAEGGTLPGRGETILVVEDEAMVREFSTAALGEAGYRVLAAEDGPGALALLDANPDVALLFTDVVLTGPMNGRAVADEALRRRPALKVLFTTGYTRNAIIHHGRLDDGVHLVGKPFTVAELTAKARALLDGG